MGQPRTVKDAAITVSALVSPATDTHGVRRDARRTLQLVLATLWVVDGLLQFQPFMFSQAFGTQMLAAMAQGNPSSISHSMTWADLVIGHHSVLADALFGTIQLVIGFGIAWNRTIRPALALSIAWALVVWWFGEGLGGLFAGTANPVNGAPGAVLLYAVLAVLLWPAETVPAPPRSVAVRAVGERVANGVWVVLWGALGCVAVLGVNRSPQGLNQLMSQIATGQPRWMAGLDHRVANLLAHRGLGVSVGLALVLVVIALGVFLPVTLARVTVGLALVLGLGIWVVGENFGGVFTGSGTDPNSGPLLMLMAVAYWPSRPSPVRPAVGSAAAAGV